VQMQYTKVDTEDHMALLICAQLFNRNKRGETEQFSKSQ